MSCARYDRRRAFRACEAFEEIPAVIWEEGGQHTSAVDGDGGLLFEQDTKRPAPLKRRES